LENYLVGIYIYTINTTITWYRGRGIGSSDLPYLYPVPLFPPGPKIAEKIKKIKK
jgi:hypothetical protein